MVGKSSVGRKLRMSHDLPKDRRGSKAEKVVRGWSERLCYPWSLGVAESGAGGPLDRQG